MAHHNAARRARPVVLLLLLSLFGVVSVAGASHIIPSANPPMPSAGCDARVALLLDVSSSITTAGAEDEVRDAAASLINTLAGTNAEVGMFRFWNNADTILPYTSMTTSTGVNAALAEARGLDFLSGTNWEAGFREVYNYDGTLGQHWSTIPPTGTDLPDIVVIVTDGLPTRNVDDTGTVAGPNTVDDLDGGVEGANLFRDNGVAIAGIGVANVDETNLQSITGPDGAAGGGDDYWITDFATLGRTLFEAATELCPGAIRVEKLLEDAPGAGTYSPADGVEFTGTGATFLWPAGGVGTTADGGLLIFRWDTGAASVTLTETPVPGYDISSVVCTGGTATHTPSDEFFTVDVADGGAAICEVYNDQVSEPAIQIVKSPDPQTIASGGDATWTIDVTNIGTEDLVGVLVTDALAPDCDNTVGDLAVGITVSYTCTLAGITASFTNSATVTGADAVGTIVSDTDTADVVVPAPAIEILKTALTPEVVPGGDATFEITVTNTGNEDLTLVTVTDGVAPDCDNAIGDLAVGESVTYTCTLAGVTADLTNVADVTGIGESATEVSDTASADVRVLVPSISITKDTLTPMIASGNPATFEIVVLNDGEVDLTNVTVTDPIAPDCDRVFAALAIGASEVYTCTLADVTADVTNVASVTGDTPNGPQVAASDDAVVDVINPSIGIVKDADPVVVTAGTPVTITITVTNTGDVALTGVVVADPTHPACANDTLPDLAVGATTSYTCEVTPTVDVVNVATVSGVDPLDQTVSAEDDAAIDVVAPAIGLVKTVSANDVEPGTPVTWTFTVTNEGDVALTDVTVTDDTCPPLFVGGDTDADDQLDVDETWTYECNQTITVETVNVAVASGFGPDPEPVTATDTETVTISDTTTLPSTAEPLPVTGADADRMLPLAMTMFVVGFGLVLGTPRRTWATARR